MENKCSIVIKAMSKKNYYRNRFQWITSSWKKINKKNLWFGMLCYDSNNYVSDHITFRDYFKICRKAEDI